MTGHHGTIPEQGETAVQEPGCAPPAGADSNEPVVPGNAHRQATDAHRPADRLESACRDETSGELNRNCQRRARVRHKPATFFLWLFPIALAVLYWITFPFSDTLSSRHVSLTGLSSSQTANIRLAAQRLHGVVIKPGEEFSFNGVVGPRTRERGFMPAPSYLGSESPDTIGGGICLASSALYQAALEAGCRIKERVPHLRTVRSVPAGLDAAVWYGRADLKFQNPHQDPIQIHTDSSGNRLAVSILGRGTQRDTATGIELRRHVAARSAHRVVVEVYRRLQNHGEQLISRDSYQIAN